ncbi:MAG TPA: murein transglycosylase A [Acetobacteraceae bacterium]|nr:murein transglycosylase A [Acetobacteraceae bacterium]
MELTPVAFSQLPGWDSDRVASAMPAFLAGCGAMTSRSALGGQGEAARLGGTPADWQHVCAVARAVPPGSNPAARAFFEQNLQAFAVAADGTATGLFTGYYEPELRGSLTRRPGYETPLLPPPADLVQADLGAFDRSLAGRKIVGRVEDGRLIPYYDRAEIEAGTRGGRGAGLLWVADPIDAFFLEIQGSGRIRLPDRRVIRVSYAGENGRPYVAIGRVLIDRGELSRDEVSLQTIREWLSAHPAQASEVMDQNPSYVFFRVLPAMPSDQGPPGSLGAALTPGRSLAVDTRYIPLGAPLWIDTSDPLDNAPLRRLMIAQDTGGAIKGPVRGDFFWGWGVDAEARGGTMKSEGTAYLLLPR